MIYSLTGKILKKTLDTVVISCAGVGYAVQVPLTTAESLPAPGREGTVYTVMNVTENDVSLYGFATEEQRSCFKMLTSVSGVGPKAGLAILSIMTPERVALGGVQRGPQGVYQGERRWPQAGPAYCSGTERQSGQGLGGWHWLWRRGRSSSAGSVQRTRPGCGRAGGAGVQHLGCCCGRGPH